MKTMWKMLVLSMLSVLAACGEPTGGAEPESEELGTLEFALTAVDSEQQEYRLRNATFSITGYSYELGEYVTVEVSSEDDPDADLIRKRILEGYYTVELLDSGWYFERLGDDGYELVEQSVLLGSNSQSVYVYQDTATDVTFRFGVDGDELDFLGGDLNIGITVERPAEAAAE